MAKSKKRKNSNYQTSMLSAEENSADSKEKKSSWAKAQEKAKDRQKKKNQQPKQKKEKGGIKEYFKGVKLEMKKVVWPTKNELGAYTVIVLCTCAAFALLFWGVDSGTLAAIRAICF